MKKHYFEKFPSSLDYYQATANPAPKRKSLHGSKEVDVCIVGGGYTGISTAHFLKEKRRYERRTNSLPTPEVL